MYSSTPLENAKEARRLAIENGIKIIVYDKNAYGEDISNIMGAYDDGITWIGIRGQQSAPDDIHFDNLTKGQTFLNFRA
jgi:hypothetical protein